MDRPNYITPAGLAALNARYRHLQSDERPKMVEIVSWAAGNGDRSENGDYLYGKKRLREIDRELRHLSKRIKLAVPVDPALQTDHDKVRFGATVTIVDENEDSRTITLVGEDEADAGAGRISWRSPLGFALKGAAIGDLRRVTLPAGEKEWEVAAIVYAAAPSL